MTTHKSLHGLLTVAFLLGATSLTACPGDDTGQEGTSGDTTDGTTAGTTVSVDSTSSSDDRTGTSSSSSSGVDETATTGDEGFVFPDDPLDDYTQIDRHGAVEAGTAGILASQGLALMEGQNVDLRDMYNASNPEEDAAGMWLGEISDSVTFFHDNIDDDLTGLGFTPASVDTSLAQAGPVIVPDTIKYDPSMATSYPNGRTLTDPVVDITLAAVLLDLGEHPLTAFADLPLNPPENDVAFEAEFPYLADPH
jgi:hypothetical protein